MFMIRNVALGNLACAKIKQTVWKLSTYYFYCVMNGYGQLSGGALFDSMDIA